MGKKSCGQIWALNVPLKLSTKKRHPLKSFQWGELSSKYDFKMPFNCGSRIDWRPHEKEKEMGDLGTIVIIQDCGSEGLLYGDRNENDGRSREMAAVGG